MTDKQPEALRLAAWADSFSTVQHDQAAAELRRLHAENAELLQALQAFADTYGNSDVREWMRVRDQARAAILKATKVEA